MRQSSREGDSDSGGRGRGRRYSTTIASSTVTTAAAAPVSVNSQDPMMYNSDGVGGSQASVRSTVVAATNRSYNLTDTFSPHSAGSATGANPASVLFVPANAAAAAATAAGMAATPPAGTTLLLAMPPRPDSNMPLNLADPSRKRKSPPEQNALIDAQSVREVWLNSQKKSVNIRYNT
jgi:hypothetical protein